MKSVKAFHNSAAAFRAAACACAFACGIAFADAPATATWTGGGDRNVLTDPANWQCRDSAGNVMEGAIPDVSATTVSVTGATTFNFPAGQTAIWKSLTVSGTVTLAADCDWRGAGSMFSYVAANSTLNLKGHNLYVAVPNGSANRKITVTDDSVAGSGGEFHFEVAEGTTFSNGAAWNNDSQIWFDGTVKAVKDGKGSYLIGACHGAKNFKFYKHSGGTTVHEGLMLILNDGEGTANETYYAQSTRPVFGAYGSPITIEAGGIFDYKGIYDLHLYKMYMNGGTFTNTRMPREPGWGTNGAIDFGADSFINVARTAHIAGPFILNGHTLYATIAANQTWHCRSGSASNGTVKLEGDGVFQVSYEAIAATNNATYDIACALDIAQPIAVSNYVARYEGNSNSGTAEFRVHGTFTPVTDNFYPATMQNGSAIDLSGRSGAWSSTGSFGALKFAPGAVVTIDVGARSIAHGERVLAWSAIPENVSFRIVGTSITATESARIEADGVYYDVPDANVVAVAHWTGAGARNDFDDPANWVCTNMVGALAANAVPGARSAVYFGTFNFDIADAAAAAKLSAYQSVALEPPGTLATDCDWRGLGVNDSLFAGQTINLGGHALKLTAQEGISQRAFTVTDNAPAGGNFVLNVPQGAVFENTLITIGGTAAFVKDGAGVFVSHRYGQPYTGGNTVVAGTLRLYNDAVADSNTFSFGKDGYGQPLGADGIAVRVETGAFYDINGIYDNNHYPVVLAGGALTSSKMQTKYSWGGLGNVTLEADSAFDMRNSIVLFNWDGKHGFNLNGHTLNIAFPEDAANEHDVHFYCRGLVVSNGTMAVTGKGALDVNGSALEARTATLDLASSVILNAAANVSNYVARYTGEVIVGSNPVNVYGTFKPVADRMRPTVLHDGATIDLSALSGTLNANSPIGALSFDAAAGSVTVDVGARALQANEHLIAWDAAPEGVAFTLVGDNVDGSKICVIENGVFYDVAEDSRLVTSASWTGQAGDGDIANPGNWSCFNAHGNSVPNGVPGASAKVVVSGTFGAGIPTASAMPWQGVTFGSLSLMADMDMRGMTNFFAFVQSGSTIDLRGHRLYVNTPNGNPPVALTVTDSTTDSSKPGELHIAVPAGATFTNNRVTLSGNLKLVKEGAGTFIPQVYRLAYTGGNVVAEGTLRLYNGSTKDNATYAFGQNNYPNPLGAYGAALTVEEGCEFDINGVYDTNLQHFRLNGGAIVNSRGQGQSLWGGFGNVTLAADSTVTVGNNILWTGPIDFGGNTLACSIASGKTFYFRGTATDGTLRTTGAGMLQVATEAGSQTMDLDAATALNVAAALTVRDYTARYEGTSNAGTAAMNVHGTFTPVTDNFYGCTLQNGATLDITSKTGVWSTTGAFTSGLNAVTFAADSVVNVAIAADRELAFDENGLAKVVSWETEPPESTKFKLAGPALRNSRPLLRRSGGLYLMRSTMMIIIR